MGADLGITSSGLCACDNSTYSSLLIYLLVCLAFPVFDLYSATRPELWIPDTDYALPVQRVCDPACLTTILSFAPTPFLTFFTLLPELLPAPAMPGGGQYQNQPARQLINPAPGMCSFVIELLIV